VLAAGVLGGVLAGASGSLVPVAPALAGSPAPVTQGPLSQGVVLHVPNGQELLVRVNGEERRVRLACVQAPRPEQQPWARQARTDLLALSPSGSPVSVELRGRDVFAREVAVVRRNGQDLAAALLRRGALFRFDGYLGLCHDLGYEALEAQARQRRLGVWSTPGGIERPWDLLQRQGDTTAEP
jgi:micrococcal nuclease